MKFEFTAPGRIIFGAGSAGQIPALTRALGSRALVVLGRSRRRGEALLAELAARLRAAGTQPQWQGEPAGLSELRAAYRLTPGLDFPGASSAPK